MANIKAVKTGNWSDTTVWDGGVLPGSSDVAYSNTYTVTIDQDITVQAISNAAGTGITLGGGFVVSTSRTLTMTNPNGIVCAPTGPVLLSISAGSGSNRIVTLNADWQVDAYTGTGIANNSGVVQVSSGVSSFTHNGLATGDTSSTGNKPAALSFANLDNGLLIKAQGSASIIGAYGIYLSLTGVSTADLDLTGTSTAASATAVYVSGAVLSNSVVKLTGVATTGNSGIGVSFSGSVDYSDVELDGETTAAGSSSRGISWGATTSYINGTMTLSVTGRSSNTGIGVQLSSAIAATTVDLDGTKTVTGSGSGVSLTSSLNTQGALTITGTQVSTGTGVNLLGNVISQGLVTVTGSCAGSYVGVRFSGLVTCNAGLTVVGTSSGSGWGVDFAGTSLSLAGGSGSLTGTGSNSSGHAEGGGLRVQGYFSCTRPCTITGTGGTSSNADLAGVGVALPLDSRGNTSTAVVLQAITGGDGFTPGIRFGNLTETIWQGVTVHADSHEIGLPLPVTSLLALAFASGNSSWPSTSYAKQWIGSQANQVTRFESITAAIVAGLTDPI